MEIKWFNWAFWLSIAILLLFWPLSWTTGISSFFWPDSIVFMVILSLFYYFRKSLNLSMPVYTLVAFGFITHSLGTLGWYGGANPWPIQWDHITHFFGLFGMSMLFFRAFERNFDRVFTARNFGIVLTIFLATQGLGALVELTEFVGFLNLGFGEGALRFGPGDFQADGFNINTAIDWVGGGWINTGWDLTFNFIGAFFGLALILLHRKFFD